MLISEGREGRVGKPSVATGQDQPQGRKNKVQRSRRAGRQLATRKGAGLTAWRRVETSGRPTGSGRAVGAGSCPCGGEERQHLGRPKAQEAGADPQAPWAAAIEQGAGRGREWRRLIPG